MNHKQQKTVIVAGFSFPLQESQKLVQVNYHGTNNTHITPRISETNAQYQVPIKTNAKIISVEQAVVNHASHFMIYSDAADAATNGVTIYLNDYLAEMQLKTPGPYTSITIPASKYLVFRSADTSQHDFIAWVLEEPDGT